jgi:hypothetical protein
MFRLFWITKKSSGVMTFTTHRAFSRMVASFRDDVQWHAIPRETAIFN